MSREIINEKGSVVISKEVLSTITGIAATDCFGVVGMSSKNFKDGIATILGRESFSKGVEIVEDSEGLVIKIYIVVAYGTKISEIASNVVNRVKYSVKDMTGLEIENVQLVVQDVRVLD